MKKVLGNRNIGIAVELIKKFVWYIGIILNFHSKYFTFVNNTILLSFKSDYVAREVI